jgi:hypothetical protein
MLHLIRKASMKTKTKKVLLIVIVTAVIMSGVSHFLFGYIPVVGYLIANSKLTNYVGSFVSAKYSFFPYGDGYYAMLDNGTAVKYDLRQNIIFDSKLSRMYQHKADQHFDKIRDTLYTRGIFPEKVYVGTWVDADNHEKIFHRIELLSVFNDELLDETQSFHMPAKIAQDLIQAMGSDYNFRSVHVIYGDLNGMYECIVKFDRDTNLTEQVLVNATTKLLESELPEDYFQWLDQQ